MRVTKLKARDDGRRSHIRRDLFAMVARVDGRPLLVRVAKALSDAKLEAEQEGRRSAEGSRRSRRDPKDTR
jgi:hypothetical protein